MSRYPGYGVGFKVYSKFWPENTFYHVKKVHLFVSIYLAFKHLFSHQDLDNYGESGMKMVN
jgi:hypothetical protein